MTPARPARRAPGGSQASCARLGTSPDPLRSLRARQAAATGDAAERAWMADCLRRGAIVADRVGANRNAALNHDLFGVFDTATYWPDRLELAQVRATANPPNLGSVQWTTLRALPELPAVVWLLVWLTPAGEWRRWRLHPDGRRVAEGAEDADARTGRGADPSTGRGRR